MKRVSEKIIELRPYHNRHAWSVTFVALLLSISLVDASESAGDANWLYSKLQVIDSQLKGSEYGWADYEGVRRDLHIVSKKIYDDTQGPEKVALAAQVQNYCLYLIGNTF